MNGTLKFFFIETGEIQEHTILNEGDIARAFRRVGNYVERYVQADLREGRVPTHRNVRVELTGESQVGFGRNADTIPTTSN